jgi:hypothetical protein
MLTIAREDVSCDSSRGCSVQNASCEHTDREPTKCNSSINNFIERSSNVSCMSRDNSPSYLQSRRHDTPDMLHIWDAAAVGATSGHVTVRTANVTLYFADVQVRDRYIVRLIDLDFADADEENGYQKCPLLDIFVAVSHSTSSRSASQIARCLLSESAVSTPSS